MIARRRTRRHNRSLRKQSRQLETLENRIVLDSTVVINEIMYNPTGDNDAQTEWIELYNQLRVDMDISEWQLSGAVDYTFPDGTVVPGRGHLVIASDPPTLSDAGTFNGAMGPWAGQLSNAGELIQLYNNDGRLMNEVDYDDTDDWPSGPDGSGASLTKIDQMSASHVAENWTHSPQIGGTIGVDNFIKPGAFRSEKIFDNSAEVRAMVPTNGDLGLTWIAPEFDDSGWTTGTLGVGHDGSSRPTYDPFLGLDLDEPPNGQDAIPIADVNGSVYMRIHFDAEDVSRYDRLRLQARFDDGFVAFLNGVEVTSANAPGRNDEAGELSWDSLATRSHSDRQAVLFESFDLTQHVGLMKDGENVLAVQGMNQSLTGNDTLFDFEIVGDINLVPPPVIPVSLNEVAAYNSEDFFVELMNTGDEPVPLNGMSLTSTDAGEQEYVFGDRWIEPNATLAVTHEQLGFRPQDTERILLYSADKQNLVDGRRVTARLRGQSDQHDGDWLYPSAATPGESNTFVFQDDIVINEIMYHPHPVLAVPDTPPEYDRSTVIEMTSEWRYNASGSKYNSDWAEFLYDVDEVHWKQGPGPLGFESSTLPVPLSTELDDPRNNDPPFQTYYFQTDFDLTAEQLADIDTLELKHIVDDGAVFYLNGREVHRFNIASGPVDPDTGAERVSNATVNGPETISIESLQVGKNTFSVEVHNRRPTDSDVVFGAELVQGKATTELIPGSPFRQLEEEEWIEIYNKGDQAVDLSGWSIRDGIRFDFPAGTQLAAGEYALIANDADHLRQKYTDVRIIGSFDGRLSDHDDRILLRDANENPADDVHYFEGGTWPSYADGGAVSLELTNPEADNSKGAVWAASDDASESEWTSHTYRGTSLIDIFGRANYDEFLFGLLGPGEFLIDDIEVIADPDGEAVPLMQNGTFEADTIGDEPDKWRLIGNHSGVVVADPEDANNQVLHMTSTGAMAHVHDHAETTFANGERIDDGTDYEISYRAKWVAGYSQLNSRLWFNRLSNTAHLDIPDRSGSPGVQNSTYQANVGPVYADFQHGPITPAENEEVTVQVRAADVDGVGNVKLHWRPDRGDWNSVDMTLNDDGKYKAVIPGHESGDIVQFYVEAEDGRGTSSMYPARGPDSRALFQVDDGRGPRTAIDAFRMIMMDADHDDMVRNVNLMSNKFRGITLVHDGISYYDTAARMIGSRFIRPNSGYKIRLNPEQPFYGVHDSIRFDIDGLGEIVLKQMVNRTGGSKASQYDDIGYLLAPNRGHSREVLVQLARYENLYLNEQFANGSDGTKFELDDVTVPAGPRRGGETLKTGTNVNTGQDIGGNRTLVRQQGDNPEFYRAHLLIKSNRQNDDYASMVRLAEAIHTDGDELFQRTNEVMDVDLWMRHYAHQSFFGSWDTYGFGRPKNLRIYVRPSDNKMIPLMWDCDRCPMSDPIKKRTEPLSRLDEIRDIPHNLRLYWGHMNDFLNTSFTTEYVSRWATHYNALATSSHGADVDFNNTASRMNGRISRAITDMERDIPRVDFEITTNGGNDLQVDEPSILLEGKGWLDIRHLRIAGTDQPLSDVFWPESDVWQVSIPLAAGANSLAIEAIDYRGNLIATDTINVTSSVGDPVSESLRVTELYYNPADPSPQEIEAGYNDADDFEFIELTNTGGEKISLQHVKLVRITDNADQQGVDFDFAGSSITELDSGQSVLVVEDLQAFQFRFGNDLPVAGQWSGGLGNGGKMVTVENVGVLLQQFTYDDAWYPSTDGDGRSLQMVDPTNPDLSAWSDAGSWRPSAQFNGTPGQDAPALGDSNGDGVFSSEDLVLVLQAGEYEDDIPDNSTFQEGDWDGDGDFNTSDLVFVFRFGTYVGGATAANSTDLTRNVAAEDLQLQPERLLNPREHSRVVATLASSSRVVPIELDQLNVDAVFESTESDEDEGDDELAELLVEELL